MGWVRRRWLLVLVGAIVLATVAGLTADWFWRMRPPYPTTEGTPYPIAFAADGCPADGYGDGAAHDFVDSPGPLVPTGASEIIMCTKTNFTVPDQPPPPRQRVLRTDVDGMTAIFNGLEDRNQIWHDWQVQHGGFWPDWPPPGIACPLLLPAYEWSYVFHYPDRAPVAVVPVCPGLTTGTRTRMQPGPKATLDAEFLKRFNAQ
jgi:hypothetical protein